eukprot:3941773-Rhodomonas_salina.3
MPGTDLSACAPQRRVPLDSAASYEPRYLLRPVSYDLLRTNPACYAMSSTDLVRAATRPEERG